MALIVPLTKPSRTLQAVWAYWLTSSAGFKATAGTGHTSRYANSAAFATRDRLAPLALPKAQSTHGLVTSGRWDTALLDADRLRAAAADTHDGVPVLPVNGQMRLLA